MAFMQIENPSNIRDPKVREIWDYISTNCSNPLLSYDITKDAYKFGRSAAKELGISSDKELKIFLKSNNLLPSRPIFIGDGSAPKGIKSNIDDINECCVVYFLLKEANLSEENAIMNISIEEIEEYIANPKNEKWAKSTFNSANTILNFLNKINKTIKNYNIHHKSKEFNNLKQQGKKLSNLGGEDKWNPADIFLIRKGLSIPNFKDILSLNDFVNNTNNIISISLKKGKNEALGGSKSVLSIYPELKYITKQNFNDFTTFYPYWSKVVRDIIKYSDNTIIFNTDGLFEKGDIYKNIEYNAKATNFWKGYPLALAAILHILKTKDYTKEIERIVRLCASKTEKSAKFIKVMGNNIDTESIKSFKVEYIATNIKLNGDADIRIKVRINGEEEDIQIRSKGSASQFILLGSSTFKGILKNKLKGF